MPDLTQRAIYRVHRAIKKGDLPSLDGTVMCVDCGKPASEYDHRDYKKPLAVEPVCRKCNRQRGPASNHPSDVAKKSGGLFLRLNIVEPRLLYIAEYVQKEARAQCRTTCNQVLWMLEQYIQQHSATKGQADDQRRSTNRVQPTLRRNREASRGAGGAGNTLPPTQGATD